MTAYIMETASGFAKLVVCFLFTEYGLLSSFFLQSLSVLRRMNWNLTRAQDGVLLCSGLTVLFLLGLVSVSLDCFLDHGKRNTL